MPAAGLAGGMATPTEADEAAWLARSGLTLISRIGTGGMATVYRVRRGEGGADLALKVLRLAHGTVRRRLLREARVLRQLRHPHIVRLHDVVMLEPGIPALLMDYVAGVSLSALVLEHPPSVAQLDDLARQLLGAVAWAHGRRVVHRDLKPDNVLVQVRGADLHLAVADFGLARVLDAAQEGLTRTGALVGTPGYIAPEQYRDPRAVDACADVFSLGVLLHQVATGRRPFAETAPLRYLAAVEAGPCPSLAELRPDLPERMRAAVGQALAPDPEGRPADAGEMLRRWEDGTACPAPAWSGDLLRWIEARADLAPVEAGAGPTFNTPGFSGEGVSVASRAAPSRAAPSRAAPSRAAPSRAAPSRAAPSRAAPSRAASSTWTSTLAPRSGPGASSGNGRASTGPGPRADEVAAVRPVGQRLLLPIAAVGLAALLVAGLGQRRPDVAATEPSPPSSAAFRRLTYNPVDRQIEDAALAWDGGRLLLVEDGALQALDVESTERTSIALPEGATIAGPVGFCGPEEVAATLQLAERGTGDIGIWIRGAATGAWRQVVEGVSFRRCSWEGDLLAAVDERSGDGRRLLVVDVAAPAEPPRRVASVSSDEAIAHVAFSPEGDRVAFERVGGLGGESGFVTRMELVSTRGDAAPITLADDLLWDSLAWSADGRIFHLRTRSHERDDRWSDLVVSRLDGAGRTLVGQRRISQHVGPAAGALSVSRDGRRLAMVTVDRQRRAYVGRRSADGSGLAPPRSISEGTAPAFVYGWVDDDTVLVSQVIGGISRASLRDLEGGAAVPLSGDLATGFGQTRIPGRRDAWLYQRREEGSAQLSLVLLDGGRSRVLHQWPDDNYLRVRYTRCAPGPRCLFSLPVGDRLSLYEVDASGLEPLTDLECDLFRPFGWDLSPDGRQVVWTAPDGVRIRDLATGETRRLPDTDPVQEVAWMRDGRLVGTALGLPQARYALVEIDPRAGGLRILHPDVGWLSHLSASPGGAALAWTRTTYDVVAWAIDLVDAADGGPPARDGAPAGASR